MKAKSARIGVGQRLKLSRLLDMEYKPSEIADIVGINVKTIYRSYIPMGLPIRRDSSGNIWIHGCTYRDWVLEIFNKSERPKRPMSDDEFYCARCRNRVHVENITQVWEPRFHLRASCVICGTSVSKFVKAPNDTER